MAILSTNGKKASSFALFASRVLQQLAFALKPGKLPVKQHARRHVHQHDAIFGIAQRQQQEEIKLKQQQQTRSQLQLIQL